MTALATARFDPADPRPVTRVAVGILVRLRAGRAEVLLAERPPNKVYGGYWEFPGGKIEPGETAEAALIRELREELGVIVHAPLALATERFSYPHAHVALEFFVCRAFDGEPVGREGQRLAWQCVRQISVEPLLPALLHPASRVLASLSVL
ncbi:MAG: NUDIX domain-containing protein [Casimicrobiaceae bacterium]